jgi:hypothetical protein
MAKKSNLQKFRETKEFKYAVKVNGAYKAYLEWEELQQIAFIKKIENERNKLSKRFKKVNKISYGTYGVYDLYLEDDIWKFITCMRINEGRDNIYATFRIGNKSVVDNMKVYANDCKIADVKRDPTPNTLNFILTINNYEANISDDCPKKEEFLFRIKDFLLTKLLYNGYLRYSVDPNSHNAAEFQKLLILR